MNCAASGGRRAGGNRDRHPASPRRLLGPAAPIPAPVWPSPAPAFAPHACAETRTRCPEPYATCSTTPSGTPTTTFPCQVHVFTSCASSAGWRAVVAVDGVRRPPIGSNEQFLSGRLCLVHQLDVGRFGEIGEMLPSPSMFPIRVARSAGLIYRRSTHPDPSKQRLFSKLSGRSPFLVRCRRPKCLQEVAQRVSEVVLVEHPPSVSVKSPTSGRAVNRLRCARSPAPGAASARRCRGRTREWGQGLCRWCRRGAPPSFLQCSQAQVWGKTAGPRVVKRMRPHRQPPVRSSVSSAP